MWAYSVVEGTLCLHSARLLNSEIRSQDITTLKLTRNPSPSMTNERVSNGSTDKSQFICPLTVKEMNGGQPFVYLATCGCVFSQSGLKAIASSSASSSTPPKTPEEGSDTPLEQQLELCPQCVTKYDPAQDVRMINPPSEKEEEMREAMEARRAAAKSNKGKNKKRKAAEAALDPTSNVDGKAEALKSTSPAGTVEGPQPERTGSASVGAGREGSVGASTLAVPLAKRPHLSHNGSGARSHGGSGSNTPTPTVAISRSVMDTLAEEETKRKARMTDTVKSLYESKNGGKVKETFMTRGTFTRVSLVLVSVLGVVMIAHDSDRLIAFSMPDVDVDGHLNRLFAPLLVIAIQLLYVNLSWVSFVSFSAFDCLYRGVMPVSSKLIGC